MRKRTLKQIPENLRSIFAAFANMAQCNAHTTFKFISKVARVEEDLQNLESSMKTQHFRVLKEFKTLQPEQQLKIIDTIHRHFPFLKPFVDNALASNKNNKTPNALNEIIELRNVLFTLDLIRTFCSHSNLIFTEKQETDYNKDSRKIINGLKNTYDGARRIVKDRFSIDDKSIKFTERYKFNSKTKKAEEDKSFRFKMDTDSGELSGIGIAFTICLFLNKAQITEFLKTADIYGNLTEEDQKIIREIFSVYRIIRPKNKIESQMPRHAFGLDMMNELMKCPKELFETFGPKNQNLFRVQGDNDGEYERLYLRHQDRFQYFMQRYIDEFKVFDDIRFQVALGSYRFKFYNKKCVDSVEPNRVRCLQKDLNGFGRLSEIEAARKSLWEGLIRQYEEVHEDTADEQPYITDERAHYITFRNKIGMFFPNGSNTDDINKMENIDGNFLPKVDGDNAPCASPTCWLSTYELPALIFHHYLSKDNSRTENIIKQAVNNYHRLFTDINDGTLKPMMGEAELENALKAYNIQSSAIPTNMKDYLLGKNRDMGEKFLKYAEEKVRTIKEKTQYRLECFKEAKQMIGNRKDNKIGKKNYVDIRPGRLASYLAEDIVRMMPVNDTNTNKPTGLNYSVIQSNLALFNNVEDLPKINRILSAARINCGEYPHPFIKKVTEKNPQNVVEFYEHYLMEKIKYMEEILNSKAYKETAFLHANRLKWEKKDSQFFQDLAKRYLQIEQKGQTLLKGIDLPRHLFDEDIKGMLKERFGDLINTDGVNVAYLIQQYFKLVENDEPQSFYKKGRSYKFFDIIINEKSDNKLVKHYLKQGGILEYFKDSDEIEELKEEYLAGIKKKADREIEEKRLNAMWKGIEKNEKTIRRYQTQDTLIFLIAKSILTQEEDGISGLEEFKLQDITPENDKSILNSTVDMKVFYIPKGSGEGKEIIFRDVKIKNIGDIYQILYDDRLESLLILVSDNSIESEKIKEEFNNYDIQQRDIFQPIYRIENIARERYNWGKGDESPSFSSLINYLNNKTEKLDTEEAEMIVMIRNNFSHNSYSKIENYSKSNQVKHSSEELVDTLRKKDMPKISIEMKDIFEKLSGKYN